jgi:hypothetical protein
MLINAVVFRLCEDAAVAAAVGPGGVRPGPPSARGSSPAPHLIPHLRQALLQVQAFAVSYTPYGTGELGT